MANRKGSSGPSRSSREVMLPSGPKTYSVRKWTLAFSPSKPRENLNNNSGYFFPANVKADVINTLEGTSYHQGNQIVDDYLNSFQALVSDAGYCHIPEI